MLTIDYSSLRVDEVVRRYNAKCGDNAITISPGIVIELLLRHAVTIPIYRTTIVDPVDAVVELITKILPTASVGELEYRISRDDAHASYELGMCYSFGLNGVRKDHKTAVRLYNESYVLWNTVLCSMSGVACMANLFRSCSFDSCAINAAMDRFIVSYGPIKHDCIDRMGDYIDIMVSKDYVCIMSLLLAAEASVNPIMNTNTTCYTTNVQRFLERHPEAFALYKTVVSLPCGNSSIERPEHMTEPGAVYRCDKCNMPYCSTYCRDGHVCHPDHDVPNILTFQQNTDRQMSYLEHILHVFGIELPEKRVSQISPGVMESRLTGTYSADFYGVDGIMPMLVIADAFVERGLHLQAINLYDSLIRSMIGFAERVTPRTVLVYRKAKCLFAVGDYREAAISCKMVLMARRHIDNDIVTDTRRMLATMANVSDSDGVDDLLAQIQVPIQIDRTAEERAAEFKKFEQKIKSMMDDFLYMSRINAVQQINNGTLLLGHHKYHQLTYQNRQRNPAIRDVTVGRKRRDARNCKVAPNMMMMILQGHLLHHSATSCTITISYNGTI